jgi:predicted ribosome-associated RNA-binding protein Tma20
MLFKLGVESGKFQANCVGGNFGRMNVHPALMKYADFAFQKLWTALKRDRDQVEKMQSVKVDKGAITFVTKGPAR